MRALVIGAGGFIGSHLVKRLKERGYEYVEGIDLKYPEFSVTAADHFLIADARKPIDFAKFDEIYQLAADMGGAGYVFTGEHDADIMTSSLINFNVLDAFKHEKTKIFYSSSACVYPPDSDYTESSAYPANPDSDYGWEKLFSERLYQAYARNYGVDIRIARFHNIFGPKGTYKGGREKAPAAICRKVIENEEEIEIWGDGEQKRSFLYIDECLNGIEKLMASNITEPVNIGSSEQVTINQLAEMAMEFKGKKLNIKHIDGPLGVHNRTSNNTLIQEKLGWQPSRPLKEGLEKTYTWIASQK